MNPPEILGRSAGDPNEHAQARAGTSSGPEVTIPYTSGSIGEACVQIYTSEGDEDRGGIVIKLTIQDNASSFIPAARITPDGVEIHVAGDAEAASIVRALRGALAALPEPFRYKGDSL